MQPWMEYRWALDPLNIYKYKTYSLLNFFQQQRRLYAQTVDMMPLPKVEKGRRVN